ncbi:MAG: HDOD domain-containing protein [Chitinivibrionales bacterium]|nr:HDOD domain-containing protein [Chitinivibrionales bacterium]MBD3394532.1 HDOD domain-containing protein [Chitinivibrionales bacterium]
MSEPRIPGIVDKGTGGPLILLFSQRERIRDILTIGLTQCNYRMLLADTPYLAMIKANQFLPDLVIVDVTADNTKDLLIAARMRKSMRTKHIPLLVVIPKSIRELIERLHTQESERADRSDMGLIHVREYPFNFAELLKKVREILFQKERDREGTQEGTHGEAAPDARETARKLFDPATSVDRKLRHIESGLHKQWAFPYTVIKALDIIESDASCCSELARCVKTDLSASAAILRVANTVYYAKRGGKRVTDIQDAVVRLGFRETRNLLGCMALIDLSPDMYKRYGFTRQDFWLHSLATALIAEKLCMDCEFRRPELAFLSGLVHDLGKIPMDNNYPPVFMHLLEEAAKKMEPFDEAEFSLMGFSHATLAHFLANKWNFPPAIALALLNHHAADKILAAPRPLDRVLQGSVYMANVLAKAMGIGHSCDDVVREIPPQLLKDLRIENGISERFSSTIYRNLQLLCRYLNIPTRELAIAKARTDSPANDIIVVYDKSVSFHPITIALRASGYNVRITHQLTPEVYGDSRVALFVTQKGTPLDLMIYEDEQEEANGEMLKVFLLDVLPDQTAKKDLLERNIVFMDRNHLDMHVLLHTIDRFLDHVVVPARGEIGGAPDSLE